MTSTDDLPSPESTVTSLLASSGHLKSSSWSDSARSIRYRNREYESATEALDAYIADFQRSLRAPEMSTGQLQLPKVPVTPVLSGTRFRNKDVLKEKLTDGELDFLNLPVGPQRRDPDCVSLTTDDLLILPTDGSLPVTRISAYLTQRKAYAQAYRSTSRSLKSQDLLSSQRPSQRRRGKGTDLGGEDFPGSHPYHRPERGHQAQSGPPYTVSSRDYPRWLTSLKSDMDFSGVTSIPDQTYPTWLRDSEASSSHVGRRPAFGKLGGSHAFPPSCPGEPEASYEERLREEHSESQEPASVEGTQNDKIESLILKAEKALAWPSLGHGRDTGMDRSSSPHTEDILDHDRSWDNPPVTFKSPVPVGGAEDQLTENKPGVARKMEATASTSSGYSSRKHPGPVEALKQMLFSLQAVEQRVTQKQEGKPENTSTLETTIPGPLEEHLEACVISDPCEDNESAPGGQSLQRALHHLGRLKSLVDDMNDKERASGTVV